MHYFGAFWLDLDASNALKSSKEYITNITCGYLCRHVSCSGRNLWRASFLNSTNRNVLPSGLRKLSSGIPLHPFFSFFQQTHPHARACERHCFSSASSSCFIILNFCVKHLEHAITGTLLFPFACKCFDCAFDFYYIVIVVAVCYQGKNFAV